MKIRALKAIPYKKTRLPGDEFDAPERYARYFVKAKLAEFVDEEAPAKRKYTRRSMTAGEYKTTELSAE